MTKETAVYGLQRGEALYNCKGEDFCDKIISGDIFAVTRSNGTSYKYSYSEDADTKISDSDSIACTDTDGITYKITGAEFKELLTCEAPQPKFVIHQEYSGSTCDYQPTPANLGTSSCGDLAVKQYVEFTTDSTGWKVELDPLQITKNINDADPVWNNISGSGQIYGFGLPDFDPQENLDSNAEPPKIHVRTPWRLKRLKTGETVDSGIQNYEFFMHEGPVGKPSFNKIGGDFKPDSQKIIDKIEYSDKVTPYGYKIDLTKGDFIYNTEGCMRNIMSMHRVWSQGQWRDWAYGGTYSYPTYPDNVRVIQVKQVVKVKYSPHKFTPETIPIDYEIMEFAIKFGAIDYSTNNNIEVVYGGTREHTDDGPPKFFTPEPY